MLGFRVLRLQGSGFEVSKVSRCEDLGFLGIKPSGFQRFFLRLFDFRGFEVVKNPRNLKT
jgi:hypothetical protein